MSDYTPSKQLSDFIKDMPYVQHSTEDAVADVDIEIGTPMLLDGTVPADPTTAEGLAYATVKAGARVAVIVRGTVIVDASSVTWDAAATTTQKEAFLDTLKGAGMKIVNA